MKLANELQIAVQCAKRGVLVGVFAGVIDNNVWTAVGLSAAVTTGIYLTVKSNQIAAHAEATPKAVL